MKKKNLFVRITSLISGAITVLLINVFYDVDIKTNIVFTIGFTALWFMFWNIISVIVSDEHQISNDRSFPRPGKWNKELE